MRHNKTKFGILIMSLVLIMIVSGCSISFKNKENAGNNGGVYRTNNRGDIWQQKVLIPTITGSPKSIGAVSVNSLVMDPSDNKAIYLGSINNGLFYSYDGANSWRIAKGLGQKTINAIAVDSNAKCIIYAAIANGIYKSTDCNRTWANVYTYDNPGVKVSAVAVDHYDSTIVYIGTSRGEIIKSYDRGSTWQTVQRFGQEVKNIIISPHDSRTVFAVVAGKGIERSFDGGASWENLKDSMKEFKGYGNIKDLVVSEAATGLLFFTTKNGLLKSVDNGDTWREIKLVTSGKGVNIISAVVNPQNTDEIYYVTNTTFYRSMDGGESWTTKKLPTFGIPVKLLIDPKEPNVIYMGIKLPQK